MLADAVVSAVNVPNFAASAMDGFAVCSSDTTRPHALAVVGEAFPMRPFTGEVKPGQTARIMTGTAAPDRRGCRTMPAEFAVKSR